VDNYAVGVVQGLSPIASALEAILNTFKIQSHQFIKHIPGGAKIIL
jgi:hypothetical protein